MKPRRWSRIYWGLASAVTFVLAAVAEGEERAWRMAMAVLFAIWENTEARS